MALQYLNLSAIKTTFESLFSRPSLLLAHVKVKDLGDLRYSKLKERGIKCVVFDKDNTLTAPYQSSWFSARLQDCVQDCKEEFGASNVAICSNTAGSRADRVKNNYADAQSLQVILGLKVIHHDINKPNTPIEEVLSHFNQQRTQELGEKAILRADEIAIVGDRLIGDVLWGNSHGMLTIKTQPLTLDGENMMVSLARNLEDRLEAILRFSRQVPPPHRLVDDPKSFAKDVTFLSSEIHQ